MTDRIPREELGDIARSVRRTIERERAAGRAELFVRGASSPRVSVASAVRAAVPVRESAIATVAADPMASAAPDVTATAAEKDLFGNEVAPVESNGEEAFDETSFSLPPVHAPLHGIDLAERERIVGESLPILSTIADEARACRKCGLCETRTQAVPGVGSAFSGIVFVGEAPGADEDAQGEPFVGRAGQLLTKMIEGMHERRLIPGVTLSRETVYICNVLKCRPPENRTPLPHEVEKCSPYLERQLDALKPRVICCLGRSAAERLVGVKGALGSLRGKTFRWKGSKLIVTYHPAALLRNPNWKQPVWDDLQRLAREYLADGPLNA
jgi:DNA polymerase